MTFHGVRGSTPCPCDANTHIGGNTSCVSIAADGLEPLGFDLGTGLRFWGNSLDRSAPVHATVLLTHLHWDHVQGLPFFDPIHERGASIDIYGPSQNGRSLHDAFNEFMTPPYFPVQPDQLIGDVSFHEVDSDDFCVGPARVMVRPVPHVGPTSGYRVTVGGVSVVYISDHQEPLDGSMSIADSVLELCDGADLLIHDAQYMRHEWVDRAHWGHCTDEYAVKVAGEAGVKTLALYHHDPAHDDATIEHIRDRCIEQLDGNGPADVIAAAEGMTVALSPQ